jgi:hypothetical protein
MGGFYERRNTLLFYNDMNGNIDGFAKHVGFGLYGAWWLKSENNSPGFYGAKLLLNLSLCFAVNNCNHIESHWRRPTYINFGCQIRLMKHL